MPEVVTLTRLTIDPAEEPRLLALTRETQRRFAALPGLLSYTFWRDEDVPGRYLLMIHYTDVEASLRGYEVWGTSPQMYDVYELVTEAPDVHRVVVDSREDRLPGEMSVGQVVSVSSRTADPGLGPTLRQKLDIVFAELRSLPGCLGTMIGHREQLEEEVYGIVFWTDRAPFDASLPEKTLYEVRPYVRML